MHFSETDPEDYLNKDFHSLIVVLEAIRDSSKFPQLAGQSVVSSPNLTEP
jgi:hypothetical protein